MVTLNIPFDIQFRNGAFLSKSVEILIEEQLKDKAALAKMGCGDASAYQEWHVETQTPYYLTVSSGNLALPLQDAQILSLFVHIGLGEHLQGLYQTEFQLPATAPEQMNFMHAEQYIAIINTVQHEAVYVHTLPAHMPGSHPQFQVLHHNIASHVETEAHSLSSSSGSSSSDDTSGNSAAATIGALGLAGKMPF